jgi:hypothetical protein
LGSIAFVVDSSEYPPHKIAEMIYESDI